jgi:hypothetical protein
MSKQRSSRRSKSPTPEQFDFEKLGKEDKDAINEMRSSIYEKIPVTPGKESANEFSDVQLVCMRDGAFQSRRYEGLDFIHLPHDRIVRIVFKGMGKLPKEFPLTVRRKLSLLRRFVRFGEDGRKLEDYRSNKLMHDVIKQQFASSEKIVMKKRPCFGNSLAYIIDTRGKSEMSDDDYINRLEIGFHSLVRRAMRNKADEMKQSDVKKGSVHVHQDLINTEGFLLINQARQSSDVLAILKSITTFASTPESGFFAGNSYNRFTFRVPTCEDLDENRVLCNACAFFTNDLRRKCMTEWKASSSEYKTRTNDLYVHSSPSRSRKKAAHDKKAKQNLSRRLNYYKTKYKEMVDKSGFDVSTSMGGHLFNKDTERAAKKITNQEAEWVGQKDLIAYLMKRSAENTRRAQHSGKKTVRYCPIVLKFATFVRSKMGNSSYDFLANVFTLPCARSLNNYDTLDSNAEDGIMHQTLDDMENDFIQDNIEDEGSTCDWWRRKGVLKFDEMKIKEKICYNPHTHEIIGFEEGAVESDVIKKEIDSLLASMVVDTASKDEAKGKKPTVKEDEERKIPSTAKHILVFMFILWDRRGSPMKRVIARYSVGSSNGEDLYTKINVVIRGIAARGFIVNQIASDGATENVSAMKQLATLTAGDVFPGLKVALPKHIKVAFKHPVFEDELVFIGGKWFVPSPV